MKRVLLPVFLIACFSVHAQQTDSLLKVLKSAKLDTQKIHLLIDIGYNYWIGGDDSLATLYTRQSVELAKKAGFLKGEGKARLQIARIEADKMTNLSYGLAEQDTAYRIAVRLKDEQMEAISYVRKAQLLETNLTREKEIMPLYDKALKIFDKLKDKTWQGVVYNQKAQYMNTRGQPARAIEFLLKARKFQEEVNDLKMLRSTLPNLGVVYASLGLFQEALNAFDDADVIAQKNNDKMLEAFVLNQRADILEKQGKFPEALNILKKAAAIHEVNRGAYWLPKVYSKMGRVYIRLKDFDNALKYTEMGDRLFQQAVDIDDFLDHVVQLNYGDLFLARKQYQKVIEKAKSGLEWAEEADPPLLSEASHYHRQLAESYEATGAPGKALFHFKKYKETSDSLLNREALQKATASAMNYDFDKKQQVDKLRIQTLQNEKLTQSRNFLIGLSLLGFLIAAIILWTNRRLRHKNKELIHKNKEIEEALYKGQHIERKRLASELHDNLNTKLAALRWRLEAMDTSAYPAGNLKIHADSIRMLEDIYADVRLISHNMLPAELETHGLGPALYKLTEKLNFNPRTKFHILTDSVEDRLDSKIEYQLYSIALELVNNILKHADASQVWISLTQDANEVTLTVSDDGAGFDPGDSLHGAGLNNIKTRVDALKGMLTIDSSPQKGTRAIVLVPL